MKIFISLMFSGLLLCSTEFMTPWGMCEIVNNETSINNHDLKNLILKKINNLKFEFSNIEFDSKIKIIINDGSNKVNYKYWDWALGVTYADSETIIIKSPSFAHISLMKFEEVLEHELNHIMINRIDYFNSIPRWFKEGFAMYFTNEISLNHKLTVAKNINDDSLFDINKLNNFNNFDKSRYHLAYAQSAIYVLMIQQVYGNQTLKIIFQNLKNNQTFNVAFYNATSNSINEFNDLMYPYIKNRYKWFKLITFPNKLFNLLPLLLIIVFTYKSIKNRQIKRRWEIEEELEKLNDT